ncbi:MAG: hypothetical protein ACT4OK_13850 [Gemmobacter sp.]
MACPHGRTRALRTGTRIGNIALGMEADPAVIDRASTPAIEEGSRRAGDVWGAIFLTVMVGDDRAVKGVWVGGVGR